MQTEVTGSRVRAIGRRLHRRRALRQRPRLEAHRDRRRRSKGERREVPDAPDRARPLRSRASTRRVRLVPAARRARSRATPTAACKPFAESYGHVSNPYPREYARFEPDIDAPARAPPAAGGGSLDPDPRRRLRSRQARRSSTTRSSGPASSSPRSSSSCSTCWCAACASSIASSSRAAASPPRRLKLADWSLSPVHAPQDRECVFSCDRTGLRGLISVSQMRHATPLQYPEHLASTPENSGHERPGWAGRPCLRAQLGAARAGPARARNLGLPSKRDRRCLTDRRSRLRPWGR